MSLGNDIKNDVAIIEERMEELHIRPNYTTTSGSHAMPYSVNGIDNYTNGYGSISKLKGLNFRTLVCYCIFIFS